MGRIVLHYSMTSNKELTIRTRNITSGRYFEAAYFNMTLAEAKAHALADHPNSEVVGVWPHVWVGQPLREWRLT